MKKKRLHDDTLIPFLGLGTYKLTGNQGREAIEYALKIGYRHIDTAAMYRNEQEVGKAIKNSSVNRSDIFVTTKVWTTDLGYQSTKQAFRQSLDNLDLDYIDLYLIHWPGQRKSDRIESFQAMQELRDNGLINSIGVSNFSSDQIKEIKEECDETPAVNQVRYSIYHYKPKLLEFCKTNDITLVAYTPLNKGNKLDHPTITSIAKKHGKTEAQVALRWAIERDVVVIPKSGNENRIKENKEIFDFSLSKEEINKIDKL